MRKILEVLIRRQYLPPIRCQYAANRGYLGYVLEIQYFRQYFANIDHIGNVLDSENFGQSPVASPP
jgi:hypothetical protein